MNWEKHILPYLLLFAALGISISAAIFSVTGMAKMFSGASTNVMIVIGFLEFGKLVLASAIYQYWNIFKSLRVYYVIALIFLMGLTSGGIYGFLTDAYAGTSQKLNKQEAQIEIVEAKKSNKQEQLADYRAEKTELTTNISELTKALSNNVIEYIDKETGEKIRTTSSATRKVLQKELADAKERRNKVSEDIISLTEEIGNFDTEILEIENDETISAEVGILKAISKLTGKPDEVVINWFIWAIMFVFDPLAVSMVFGANVIFKQRSKEDEKEKLAKDADDKIAEFESKKKEYDKITAEFEKRLQAVEDEEKAARERLSSMEDGIKDKESDIKKREREVEDMMLKINSDRDKSVEEMKRQKDKIKDLEYKLTEDRSKLAQEKEDFKREHKSVEEALKNIEKDREDINKREKEMEEKLEEYRTFKNKIQNWEKLHWKQRRNIKPPKL